MEPGRRLFSFAVIADTHVNQEEGKASSDFAVNRLSNARNRYVMRALNRARPAFVLHLGDIVHPTPGHPGYGQAARAFADLARLLECPLHLTPGNHDVGDKPGDWLPVPSINEGYLALYRQHFGANYHSFDAHDCHFVVIDAQLLNSGLADEARQQAWLEQDLQDHAGMRTFLCTHYPPFVFDPAEDGHYDNIDEPGRTWLLHLLERYRVEALFAGHVHNFWFHSLRGTAFYLLPSTAFVRLDYSEMYRVEPGAEQGRNDAAKLGFLIVDVHESGHVAHPVRTLGACLDAGQPAPDEEILPPVHPRTLARSPLGIDLRHAWAEITDVAPSGALDEFTRKTVRNDYPLMALWEMGVRRLRVPMADLRNARTRERMRVLRGCGHEFTVYSHGVPEGLDALLAEHAALVSCWEVIAPLAGIAALAAEVGRVRRGHAFAVRFSRLRRPEDPLHHGQKARHVIEHGFDVSEGALVESLSPGSAVGSAFDGVTFRVPRERSSWRDLAEIARLGAGMGARHSAMVRLAGDNPAVVHGDGLEAANRVAATLFAAHFTPSLDVFLDTFADVDRGYFPRAGLVDRRYNPHIAGRVVRNLNSALGHGSARAVEVQAAACEGGDVLEARAEGRRWLLVLPRAQARARPDPPPGARWIDLSTGVVSAGPLECTSPVLLLAG